MKLVVCKTTVGLLIENKYIIFTKWNYSGIFSLSILTYFGDKLCAQSCSSVVLV